MRMMYVNSYRMSAKFSMGNYVSSGLRPLVLFTVITSLLAITDAALQKKPENKVAVVGEKTIFNCSNGGGGYTVRWEFYPLDAPPCKIFTGLAVPPNCNQSRYTIEQLNGNQFNLIIDSTTMDDAGTFVCTDFDVGGETGSAVYGILASKPNITTNTSDSCLLEGQAVVHTCEVTYNGSHLMPPSLTWNGITGSVDNSGTIFKTTIIVTATTSMSPYVCNVTFNPPQGNTLQNISTTVPAQATNAPRYNNTSQTPLYNVQYCPRSISIMNDGKEFSNGSSVTGVADLVCNLTGGSFNSALYSWTDATGAVVGTAQTLTITPLNGTSHEFSYTCTATSTIWCDSTKTHNCPVLKTTVIGISLPTTAAPTTTPTTSAAATTQPNTSGSTQSPTVNTSTVSTVDTTISSATNVTTPKTPDGGATANSTACADKVECIVPVIVCSVVGGVAIIVVIVVLCIKWSTCPGYKYLQHKHENKPNANTRNGSDNKQLTTQQQTTVHSQFTNDSYQDDNLETSRQGMAYQPTPDLTAGLHTQPTHSPPGGYLHYSSHQPPQNRPPPTPQKPVSPEGIVYAELAAKPAGSRQPVAPPSDTVYAQIQSA